MPSPASSAPEHSTHNATVKDTPMSTTTNYPVTGMTCGHCAAAVTEELTALPGVSEVSVDLAAGGTSTVTVTSDAPLNSEQIVGALDEVGDYHLATA